VDGPTIDELVLAAEEPPWRAAGFDIEDGVIEVGSVRIRLAGAEAGRRIARWSLRGVAGTELDGLPTSESSMPPAAGKRHPNGVVRLDHVVAFSPDLDRTVAALERDGLPLRRVREGPTPGGAMRQAFFRLGEVILEVIENPAGTPEAEDREREAGFYGIAFVAADLDSLAEEQGDLIGSVRDAVQPGRRIATMRREANLGLPVAFMTEPPE
jgi:catechol 2,3-dioxygenase-like lactoylglutathione lyase family enzyme